MGDVAAFSFCNDKIISTGGEGGMLVTGSAETWEKAWSFKDHGKNFAASHQEQPVPKFRWLHDTIGTNWRMTEMQAACGDPGAGAASDAPNGRRSAKRLWWVGIRYW